MAIFSAKLVIGIYEKQYPNDNRPRKAIEAAVRYQKNPTKKNRLAANTAANAAHAAANAATNVTNIATYTAYVANAATNAAANVTNMATHAVTYTANAAHAATIKKIKQFFVKQVKSLREIKS